MIRLPVSWKVKGTDRVLSLADLLILGVQRGAHRRTFDELAALPLQAGDLVVSLVTDEGK